MAIVEFLLIFDFFGPKFLMENFREIKGYMLEINSEISDHIFNLQDF
jgi:hypothetical protein